MGNVGIAYLQHDLAKPLGDFPIASSKCRERARAIRGNGVLVVWAATIDSPQRLRFSKLPGSHLRVNGWPARLRVTSVVSECAGRQLSHVHERIMTGYINEGHGTVQTMNATMGLKAANRDVPIVERIFRSVRK